MNNISRKISLLFCFAFAFSNIQAANTQPLQNESQERQLTGLRIAEIQGESHTSLYRERIVKQVKGIVTSTIAERKMHGFWLQSKNDDNNRKTSNAIFVALSKKQKLPEVGDKLSVSGKVTETSRSHELSRTTINCSSFQLLSAQNSLPEAILIGREGVRPPTKIIENDNFSSFEPEEDGLDFYESLEGMRVQLNKPVFVGSKSRFGEIPTLADKGSGAALRTRRGGILLREDDLNPEIIYIRGRKGIVAPQAQVGDYFDGQVKGILDYSYGSYKVILTEIPPKLIRQTLPREKTFIRNSEKKLVVANYNVENLDFHDKDTKFSRIARDIKFNLNSPDILALQEIQDDSGPSDDGTVKSDQTLKKLTDAIQAAGGPEYNFCLVEPQDGKDGGQPGANIRVAFLYNSGRVQFVARGNARPNTAGAITETGLLVNPARVAPANQAFKKSRKPLIAEFKFNGQMLFMINCHLNSKGGDDSIWGANQPPIFSSETQRNAQVSAINGFVDSLLTMLPNARLIILGDMNEHEFRQPIQTLAGKRLINLIEFVPEPERYTYVYKGNSQTLDHILVTRNLARPETFEIDIVHLNAEFEQSKRASDHEPLAASFLFETGLQVDH